MGDANIKSETVGKQISKVTTEVKRSHVQQFGDLSKIGKEALGDFEGADASLAMALNISTPNLDEFYHSAVNSRDVDVHLAYYEMHGAETLEEKRTKQKDLALLLAKRQAADKKFTKIAMLATGGQSRGQHIC